MSFILGVCVSGLTGVRPDQTMLWMLIAALAFTAIVVRSASARFAVLACVFLLLGFGRYDASYLPVDGQSIQAMAGPESEIVGRVRSVDEQIDQTSITVTDLTVAGEPVLGDLLVYAPATTETLPNDQISMRCELNIPEPFEGFRWDRALEARGIYAVCFRPEALVIQKSEGMTLLRTLAQMRDLLITRVQLITPEPEASFLSGVLFGGSGGLSDERRESFSRTGLSHVMAASGYNVAIFSSLLLTVLMRSAFGRRRGVLLAFLFVVAYVFVAGATPPVVRAGIMAAVAMLGVWLGRAHSMRNLLAASAAVMLAFNPRLLLDDVGFQLSFLATTGIVLLADDIDARLAFIPNVLEARTALAASLAATILTLPLMLWHFGAISLISPIANLFVLPWIPYLMAAGALALAISFPSITLGPLAAIPAWAIAHVILYVIDAFAAVPFAVLTVEQSRIVAGVILIPISVLVLWLVRPARNAV